VFGAKRRRRACLGLALGQSQVLDVAVGELGVIWLYELAHLASLIVPPSCQHQRQEGQQDEKQAQQTCAASHHSAHDRSDVCRVATAHRIIAPYTSAHTR
jgi:hypothetical protein